VDGGVEAGYQFAHDLISDVVETDLSTSRRAAVHRHIAEVLEAEPGEPAVELLAYHFARSEDQEKAIRYLERAGDRARERHAATAAAEYYRQVVDRLEKVGELSVQRARANEKLGSVLLSLARLDQALSRVKQAAETYGAAGDPEGQQRCLAYIGQTYAAWGRPQDGIGLLQPLMDSLGGGSATPSLAALQATLAQLFWVSGQKANLLEAAERA